MPSVAGTLLLFLPLTVAVREDAEGPEYVAALVDDDQCHGGAPSNCSVAMLQARSQRLQQAAGSAVERWGSCTWFGCSDGYRYFQTCQCYDGCVEWRNCCYDFSDVCEAPAEALADVPIESPIQPPVGVSDERIDPAPGYTWAQGVYGHPSQDKAYPTYDGFTLALVEEFDDPIDLDRDPIWTWSDGGLLDGDIRFVKEAISFQDGKMRIEVDQASRAQTESCSNAEVAEIGPKGMTSGEIRTKHNMFRYGRYEASIRAPMVQPGDSLVDGNYVATMFVFRDAKYKHWREIDVEITGGHPDSVTTNVLSADDTAQWSPKIAESQSVRVHRNLRTEFHTFAFEWLPDRISWYFDGQLVREKTGGSVPISDLSAKIMMNLWTFDQRALFGGEQIWNNRYPLHSEYDWFRFYRWNGDAKYPCPRFDTSCLTSDDLYLSSNNPCDNIPQVGSVFGRPACRATCH